MNHNMYKGAITWSPFVGCRFNCSYCQPSFKRQMRRRQHQCELCGRYTPHFHPERMAKVPSADLIFACAFGDISFANPDEITHILTTIGLYPDKTFLVQSKNPSIFIPLVGQVPDNVVLGTTIETNRPTDNVSQAPLPTIRATAMAELPWSRRYVTVEPILDFDVESLLSWIKQIKPEFVYVGYDNHSCKLDEPQLEKTLKLMRKLESFTEVRPKKIRSAWNENKAKDSIKKIRYP